MNHLAEASRTSFKISTVGLARAALWQDARRLCDEALEQGLAFVAILRDAGAFVDEHVLGNEDRRRAERYRRPGDRQNFMLGRTMVHQLVRPQGASTPYVVSLGVHGKPFLPGCPAYNLSHSGAWVACAISPGTSIGIDVEAFAHLRDYRELLAATTHPTERRDIDAAEPDKRLALFKRCWTRKEAVLKATGRGLSDDLCAIDVRLAESRPLLGDPAWLRLVDLLTDDDGVASSVALDISVPGIVVAHSL